MSEVEYKSKPIAYSNEHMQSQIQPTGVGGKKYYADKIECPTFEKSLDHQTTTQPPNNPIQAQSSLLGHTTELRFRLQCFERGLGVWLPEGSFHRADVIIDNGHRLLKIQIKGFYGQSASRYYEVKLCTNNVRYSKNDVDFFAVYILETNAWFILPFAASKRSFVVSPTHPQQDFLGAWDLLKTAS